MKKRFAFLFCFLLISSLSPSINFTEESGEKDSRIYFKREGNHWVKIIKSSDGIKILGIEDSFKPEIKSEEYGLASIQQVPNMFLPYTTHSVGSWPEAVAIGDVNGDGRKDVVMTTSFYFDPENDYKLFVFLQNASGQLDTPVKYDAGNGESVDIGDLNNDGRNDVAVTGANGIGVFLQNATGALDPMVIYSTTNTPDKLRIGDFNNDGLADVAAIGSGSDVNIFLQNASGTLNAPDNYTVIHGGPDDLDIGDINNDGLTDIVVMSGSGSGDNFGVLCQNSGGTFNPAVYYDLGGDESAKGVAVSDVNRDSLKDVVVTYGGNRPTSYIGVFLQNATGTLDSPISNESYDCPEPVVIGRVNRDLRQDVIVAHGGWAKMGVYIQASNGALQDEELYDIPNASHYNPQGLAIGDINSDVKNDVLIADYGNGLVVLYGTLSLVYSLTITAGEGGTTNPSPGAYTYDPETEVTITAVPESGYDFIRWSGSASGADNPITITMDSDKYIRAIFNRKYTLTIAAGEGGKTDPPPGSYIYYSGSQVKLIPIPDSKYTFSHWTGDIFPVKERDNPLFVDINSDKSITAIFQKGKLCFIATAAYSSPYHPHIRILQDFRDRYLLPGRLGRLMVCCYYKYSPSAANFIAKHRALRGIVRIGLLPLVAFSYSMLHYGPVITAIMIIFIFMLPTVFVVMLRRRKQRSHLRRKRDIPQNISL